jgi:hypothetical protein
MDDYDGLKIKSVVRVPRDRIIERNNIGEVPPIPEGVHPAPPLSTAFKCRLRDLKISASGTG